MGIKIFYILLILSLGLDFLIISHIVLAKIEKGFLLREKLKNKLIVIITLNAILNFSMMGFLWFLGGFSTKVIIYVCSHFVGVCLLTIYCVVTDAIIPTVEYKDATKDSSKIIGKLKKVRNLNEKTNVPDKVLGLPNKKNK